MKERYCSNCHELLQNDANFCPRCGSDLRVVGAWYEDDYGYNFHSSAFATLVGIHLLDHTLHNVYRFGNRFYYDRECHRPIPMNQIWHDDIPHGIGFGHFDNRGFKTYDHNFGGMNHNPAGDIHHNDFGHNEPFGHNNIGHDNHFGNEHHSEPFGNHMGGSRDIGNHNMHDNHGVSGNHNPGPSHNGGFGGSHNGGFGGPHNGGFGGGHR